MRTLAQLCQLTGTSIRDTGLSVEGSHSASEWITPTRSAETTSINQLVSLGTRVNTQPQRSVVYYLRTFEETLYVATPSSPRCFYTPACQDGAGPLQKGCYAVSVQEVLEMRRKLSLSLVFAYTKADSGFGSVCGTQLPQSCSTF